MKCFLDKLQRANTNEYIFQTPLVNSTTVRPQYKNINLRELLASNFQSLIMKFEEIKKIKSPFIDVVRPGMINK